MDAYDTDSRHFPFDTVNGNDLAKENGDIKNERCKEMPESRMSVNTGDGVDGNIMSVGTDQNRSRDSLGKSMEAAMGYVANKAKKMSKIFGLIRYRRWWLAGPCSSAAGFLDWLS